MQERTPDTPVKMNFFLLPFCVLLWNSVQAIIDVALDDAECDYTNDEYIAPGSCVIETGLDSYYGTSLTTNVEVIKQLPDDLRVVAKVYGLRMGEYSTDFGFHVDINLCEVANDPESTVQVFIKALGMDAADCPLSPGVYGVEHFVLAEDEQEFLPESFIIGKYRISITLLNDDFTLLSADIYITVN